MKRRIVCGPSNPAYKNKYPRLSSWRAGRGYSFSYGLRVNPWGRPATNKKGLGTQ